MLAIETAHQELEKSIDAITFIASDLNINSNESEEELDKILTSLAARSSDLEYWIKENT